MFFRYGREKLDLLSGAAFNSPYTQYNVGFGLADDSYLYSIAPTTSHRTSSATRA